MQVECVAQFVHAFFQEAFAQQPIIAIKSIEFLAQAMERNHRASPSELRFAKNVFQDRDIQVDAGNAKQMTILGARHDVHALQDLGRVELLTFSVISERRVEFKLRHFATNPEATGDAGAQLAEQRFLDLSDRKQAYQIHAG
jgi:hypothetical protein